MYCGACLDIFKVHRQQLWEDPKPAPHQASPFAVLESSREGCAICCHLWELFLSRANIASENWGKPPASLYIVEPVVDQVKSRPGRSSTSPPRESLSSSGCEYIIDFCWDWMWKGKYSSRRRFLRYHLIESEILQKHIGHDTSYNPRNSSASLSLQKYWINNCVSTHSSCRISSGDWLPTRVLDVGSIESQTIWLLESRDRSIEGPYMTLSHCWGQRELIKNTNATYKTLQAGIADSQLPPLYRDVVKVCRDLKIHYLWIDSLCIIQDQESDCIREIAMMGQVYTNALCNIEAMQAKDGFGYLRAPRREDHTGVLPVNVEWYEDGSHQFYFFDSRLFRDNLMPNAPLAGRAWVLQEQLLAPRTLVFSNTQVFWICQTHEASEPFPLGLPDLRRGDDLHTHSLAPRPLHYLKGLVSSDRPVYYHPPPQANWSFANASNISPWEKFWLCWRTIVLDYTSRSLTYEKDKLAAISGLASVFQSKIETQYIAGMWNFRFYIEYELCWTVGKQANGQLPYRPKEYRAPSWSWASVEGKISYSYKTDYDITGDTQLSFVERAEIQTIDGTLTGPVSFGCLWIEAPLLEHSTGYCTLDDESESMPEPIFYLVMFSLYLDQKVWGLALRRLDSGPNQGCYQRVGTFSRYFDFDDRKGYDEYYGAPKQLIMII